MALAAITLYNALVRSKLEFGAMVWNPHETKYSTMLEKIQNKFLRYLYLKMYGVYPFYPLMYPTLFVLGMVGYNKLDVRREVALALYVWRVLRGKAFNAQVLECLEVVIPQLRLRRGPRNQILEVPRSRTNLLKYAPITRAITSINRVSEYLDIWHCSLAEFRKHCLIVMDY
ncbi:hypothetical protein NE865_15475 [Phthorimaea operculella]|nr:hypothetical protein NE865_15475 [Phthorimaea operculella]